jgi:SAM-dependent methyltransferase
VRAVQLANDRKTRRELVPWLETISAPFGGFAGKAVLDVGCDLAGNMVRVLDEHFDVREAVGINLSAVNRRISARSRLEQADVRKLPYADGTFDLIVSSSAFEHITGLDEGIREMHRILKPGGHLFSHFGPIWSTSYGHHLWTAHEGRLYNYWNLILPPYCHLLMTQAEIEALLIARGHSPSLSRTIAEYVLTSPEQNHLFFEDYAAIFAASDFEVLMFKGYDHPGIAPRYNMQVTGAVLEELRERYAGREVFYDGITVLLRKV